MSPAFKVVLPFVLLQGERNEKRSSDPSPRESKLKTPPPQFRNWFEEIARLRSLLLRLLSDLTIQQSNDFKIIARSQ